MTRIPSAADMESNSRPSVAREPEVRQSGRAVARATAATVQGVLIQYEVFTSTRITGELVDASGVPRLFNSLFALSYHTYDFGRVIRLQGHYVTDAAGTSTFYSMTRPQPLGIATSTTVRHAATWTLQPGDLTITARSDGGLVNVTNIRYPARLAAQLRTAQYKNPRSLTHVFHLKLREGLFTLTALS